MSAVSNPVVRRTVDGGLSGTITVTVGTGNEGAPPMVFVESDLLASRLVLSMAEASELGFAISAAVSQAQHLIRRNTAEARPAAQAVGPDAAACTRCGLNAGAMIHHATANGHNFEGARVSLNAHAPQYREADERFDPERDQ